MFITVDFDNYCIFCDLNRYKTYFSKRLIFVAVQNLLLLLWTLCGFQVILMYNFSHSIQYLYTFVQGQGIIFKRVTIFRTWCWFQCTTGSHFTSSAKHLPMRTTTKTCQTCFTSFSFNVSSVNLDGGYIKRSFICSQWFFLSSARNHC
jgi:hypothetical protein